jgi:hypothetical protein
MIYKRERWSLPPGRSPAKISRVTPASSDIHTPLINKEILPNQPSKGVLALAFKGDLTGNAPIVDDAPLQSKQGGGSLVSSNTTVFQEGRTP